MTFVFFSTMKAVCSALLLVLVSNNVVKGWIRRSYAEEDWTETELDWWESSTYYQIYVRSFCDSNGDGIGDLRGIISKLVYLKEIGVGAICLSPMFQSPIYDFGFDISDYYAVHHEYGNMEDLENLIEVARHLGIHVILSFVPNHCSNESFWFKEAVRGNEKYQKYFIWGDGVIDDNQNLRPPNNWLSVFRKSAWEYSHEVGKYYLHQFFNFQPDLNHRNPDVVEEMQNVIKFWLDKGVSGFRVDAISHLFEVNKKQFRGKYPDEPLSGITDDTDNYSYLDHIYSKDQNETFEMLYLWRKILDEYANKDGVPRILMADVDAISKITKKYFGDSKRKGAQIILNFSIITGISRDSTAAEVKYALDKFLTFKPLKCLANWVAGDYDNRRVASRLRPELVDSINMILLLLPGIGVTYMGEEIGMVDGEISWDDTLDPAAGDSNSRCLYASRDPQRTPFQWSSKNNSGFSTGNHTWLPVAKNYQSLNVEVQRASDTSHLNVYKSLSKIRNESTFRYGRFESVAFSDGVYGFRRWRGKETFIILVNFKSYVYTIDLKYFENINKKVQVVIINNYSNKKLGDVLNATTVEIIGWEAVVLKVIKKNSLCDIV